MSKSDIFNLSLKELKTLLEEKKLSSEELARAYFERIKKIEPLLKSYLICNEELVLNQARASDENRARGQAGILEGIPLAIKDNICLQGMPTTCASKILENYLPPYNATVIEKLQSAGGIFIGKTNLDEFAMGSSTENSGIKVTANPWDLTRVPGGSSGGSAAAVAGRLAPAALGSDTGGSIRQPASFCGVVGLKPTYGRVSRYGLVAFASSLDQIGPITKFTEDAALLLNVISGHDPQDSTSVKLPVPDFTKNLKTEIKNLKIGLPKQLLEEGIRPEVKEIILKAVAVFKAAGAMIAEIDLPSFEYALPTYYLIAPAEASANLARYDGVKYGLRVPAETLLEMYQKTRQQGFGPEVKRRIMIGTYALSAGYYDAYYLKAQKVRTLIRDDFQKAFSKYDILICPTAPDVAFKIGEKVADPLSIYLSDIATIPVNLAGLPAISIPCGFLDNLPVGLQIIGKPFDEETILKASYFYEKTHDWNQRMPSL